MIERKNKRNSHAAKNLDVTKLSLSFLVQQSKTERLLIKLRKFSMQLTFNSLWYSNIIYDDTQRTVTEATSVKSIWLN